MSPSREASGPIGSEKKLGENSIGPENGREEFELRGECPWVRVQMRFKSCFRGLAAPSLRSKLGYTELIKTVC